MDKVKIELLRIQMQQWLYEVEEYVHKIPPTQLCSAVGVVLVIIILFLLVRIFKHTTSSTILLTGLSGSGKTFLFYQKGKTGPVHIVDVPVHSRLRLKLDEFLPQATGIVFVVDSVEFLPNSHSAAEYLYEILTKATVVKKRFRYKLRTSRTAVSEADISNEFTLGVPGEPFVFSHCCNKVIVAEASGLTGEISQLEQFIRENVKS